MAKASMTSETWRCQSSPWSNLFDFREYLDVSDGASLPADAVDNPFVIGTVERIAGDLHVTLILPNDPNASEATAFPDDIINPPDGPIALPVDPAPAEPKEA